jgi:alkylation response protein AidB-like acyl-CoA dehydrogenase
VTDLAPLPSSEITERTRHDLRAWLGDALTTEIRERLDATDPEEAFAAHRAWNAQVFDAGWAAPSWPSAFGGRDADLATQLACHEEMAAATAPGPINAIGVANIAPAILSYGTPEQQQRFLRPMLRGDEIWCQGMSEPEAGSDLASLRCRGVIDGDDVVVSGQKTWNSNGDRAHWCQLYVRTDPEAERRAGITCLLVDMTTPGIEVRPIRTMTGDSGFAEVFFDGVRVPRQAVLGELNDGWSVATRTLGNERAGVAVLYLRLRRKFERLLAESKQRDPSGVLPTAAAGHRQALAARYIEVRIVELLAMRTLGTMMAGGVPGPEGSVIKLAWSATEQSLAMTAVDLLGTSALEGPWAHDLLLSRSLSIAGGTSEVNRNIIGERVLGLPRDPPAGGGR